LFSTHDIALAASVAHKVMVLSAGRVIAEGAPQTALTAETLSAAYGRPARLGRVGKTLVALFDGS
jgi:iron complex transport system ATP-binding protein